MPNAEYTSGTLTPYQNGAKSFDLALTNAAGTTGWFDYTNFSKGQLTIPTGVTGVTLTFHANSKHGGELAPAQDGAGAAVTLTVAAAKSYPIPVALAGAHQVAIVSNVAGPETIEVLLKP